MPEFLSQVFPNDPVLTPHGVLMLALRLAAAMALGAAVAWVYRRTRLDRDVSPSFSKTLVLLTILIAMVTQVIGGNIARAFSLVGALSIVRFRTVVRDTQDTAYVIFAVAIGMAVGASDPWVALCGFAIVSLTAFLMADRRGASTAPAGIFLLSVRVGLGHDIDALIGPTLDRHVTNRQLLSMATTRQGVSIDASYEARFRKDGSPDELVKALNRIEGIQGVELKRQEETL